MGARFLCGTVGGAEAPHKKKKIHDFLSIIASDWPYEPEGSCQQETPEACGSPLIAIRSKCAGETVSATGFL